MAMLTHQTLEAETLKSIKGICAGMVNMIDNGDSVEMLKLRFGYLQEQFRRLEVIRSIKNGAKYGT